MCKTGRSRCSVGGPLDIVALVVNGAALVSAFGAEGRRAPESALSIGVKLEPVPSFEDIALDPLVEAGEPVLGDQPLVDHRGSQPRNLGPATRRSHR